MKSSVNYLSKAQFATIALIAFAYFVIAVTALYFLNPAYSLIRSFAGYYDLGAYEFLIASTFFSLGLGSLALVIGLYQGMAQSARSWIGLLLLGIWGVGMLMSGIFPANDGGSTVPHMTTVLLAGIFPVEVQATPETVFSFIHIIAILGSLFSLSLAAIVLSWRFKHEEKWHPIYKPALILAVVMIAVSILFCSVLLYPALVGYSGLINPIILVVIGIVVGLFWLSLIAGRLHLMGAHTVLE
jgi:Protein of unknown function (DUF998)